jgi:hypothetical protein
MVQLFGKRPGDHLILSGLAGMIDRPHENTSSDTATASPEAL